jgi:predicted nuclease of predicted toxin-antitoxin system
LSFPLYFDEDVNIRVASALQESGYDVLTTRDAGRVARGIPDEDQLSFAAQAQRAIVTYKAKDFEPIARGWALQGRSHSSITIVIASWSPAEIEDGLRRLQEMYPDGIANYCLRPPVFD